MIGTVVTHLLESTVFALGMALLTVAFSANGAHVRFWLWFAASVKFLVPFAAIVELGKRLRWDSAPTVALDAALPMRLGEFFPQGDAFAFGPLTTTSPVFPAPPQISLVTVLLLIWGTGVAFLLCRWTLQWLKLRTILKASTPALIDAPIPVRFSESLYEPGLVGMFRPTMLLPSGIAAQLTPAQLAPVIEHELAHWRRRDNLTAAIHMLVELLFWFHPLVWWVGLRLVAEREQACDEAVIERGTDPRHYADSILEVCRFYVRSPLACASGVSGASLKHRVEKIMENAKLIRLSGIKLTVLSTFAAGTLLVPVAVGLFTSLPSVAQAPSIAPTAVASPAPSVRTNASPGTEAMLRRHIASLEKGQQNFEDMGPRLEKAAREQQAEILPRFQKLGDFKTLTFKGVARRMDFYEAEFANGRVDFWIAPLQPDGKVNGLFFHILPTPEEEAAIKQRIATGKPDPEREALLRQEIDGQQKGEIRPEIRTPALTARVTKYWQMIQDDNEWLGKFISLQFLHVDQRGWDVYDATYANGHMIYRVGPLTEHKLAGLMRSAPKKLNSEPRMDK